MACQAKLMILFVVLLTSCSKTAEQPSAATPEPDVSTSKVPDIFGIYDQFAISSAAAAACDAPAPQTKAKHDANFITVSAHARRAIISANPAKSESEINEFLAKRRAMLIQETSTVVAQRGCVDPEVQQIVRRYKAQESWQPPVGS